jgi:hypothetical protein
MTTMVRVCSINFTLTARFPRGLRDAAPEMCVRGRTRVKPLANAISPVGGSCFRKCHRIINFEQVVEEWEEGKPRVRSRLILLKQPPN